ncbi:MAG TPA: zinc ribbon domain-containing protein [Anaerolineae bacterium]|nr:MAG: Double zinc ribbon [Chloroflexi bacterium ADurb.Bin222]HOC20655.1 zinc ribbon domain-containing protein [Anaerolineae bacterium]HQM13699.1 zinc ribbon domain-containing protein [Anaerolineae bacterium]
MKAEMEQRAYHGKIDTEELAHALVVQFNQGETRAQWMRGPEGRTIVQLQARRMEPGDPQTAVTLHILPSPTGIVVSMAEQQWLGVAADLARTGLRALLNPWSLIAEMDDVARNVRGLRLREETWNAIEAYCRGIGAGVGAAALLQQVICPYCGTPNAPGESNCKACRAPLAEAQPLVCGRCGFLNEPHADHCANCKAPL